MALWFPFGAFGCVELAVEAVELLSVAMVVDRCWVFGVSCVRRVEFVLLIVKICYFIQLVHSVLVSLSAVRETIWSTDECFCPGMFRCDFCME